MSHLFLTLTAVALVTGASTEPQLPVSLDPAVIRGLPVQHDGRWPPLDTVARDIVESVTGDAFHQGHDPVLWLLAWTFDPQTWRQAPSIKIGSAELRRELHLSPVKAVFSYQELVNHQHLRTQIDALVRVKGGRKLDPLESKVSDINEKLVLLQTVFLGQVIKPVPDPDEILGAWKPIGAMAEPGADGVGAVNAAWAALRKAFLAVDRPAFGAASSELKSALGALPAAHRPDPRLIDTELRYNKIRPFRTAWQVMLAGTTLAVAATFLRRKWFDGVAVVGMLAGFGVLTYGLSLRWQIAGRIPASNMFESLLFLSWGMGAFAILSVFLFRDRMVPLTASGMGALALILADCLSMDHYIRPIAPVLLDTVWMSIHVPVIMVSYSVLALAVLIAHVQLVIMAVTPRQYRLADTVSALHYWYVHVGSILLAAGILTGSMWAASSWGRYWGWDPKEVWSLVALLGYLTILHVRIDHNRVPGWAYTVGALLGLGLLIIVMPKLAPLTSGRLLGLGAAVAGMVFLVLGRGQFATAVKSILCFWLIIMTYVGVNYVLGIGLHSYGFGTGAVARYMFSIGAIDLALVALCSAVYFARRTPLPARQTFG